MLLPGIVVTDFTALRDRIATNDRFLAHNKSEDKSQAFVRAMLILVLRQRTPTVSDMVE